MKGNDKRRLGRQLTSAVYLAAVTVAVALLCGCTSTKYVPVETVKTEYVDRESARVDSVTLRDSVFVRSGGDTIWVEKWRWRDRVSRASDTVTVVKTDSVQVPYPVEKPLTRWQQAKMDFGGIGFGAVGALLLLVGAGAVRKLWLGRK